MGVTISFGLVSVPVKVQSVVRTTVRPSFSNMHSCGARLKAPRVCPEHGEVPEHELTKVVEVRKGEFVEFTPEEVDSLKVSRDTIDVKDFVPFESIDPLYLSRAYHVTPEPAGRTAYALLVAALKRTGQAAVAYHPYRGADNLCAIRECNGRLLMHYLLHGFEVRHWSDVPEISEDVDPALLGMALKLIQAKAQDAYDPDRYPDQAHARLKTMIEAKATHTVVADNDAKIVDLMGALKASLAKTPGPKPAKKVTRKKRTKKASAKA